MQTQKNIGYLEKERYLQLLHDLADSQKVVSKIILDNIMDKQSFTETIAKLHATIGLMIIKDDINLVDLEKLIKQSVELNVAFKSTPQPRLDVASSTYLTLVER